jgi:hypothetical protein
VRKADVIARCLVQSSLATDMKAGRGVVRAVFDKSFADKSYAKWNIVVDENVAASILRSVGKAKAINIEKFITDFN